MIALKIKFTRGRVISLHIIQLSSTKRLYKYIYIQYNKNNEKQDVCSTDKSMYSNVISGRSVKSEDIQ